MARVALLREDRVFLKFKTEAKGLKILMEILITDNGICLEKNP